MSLLDDFKQTCVMLDKTSISDGMGGMTTSYVDGAEFTAAIVFDNSIQARVAEKSGVTSLYTITTDLGVVLSYHDIFKRVDDGKIFRVTSDGDDKFTPSSASIKFRQVLAEEYELL